MKFWYKIDFVEHKWNNKLLYSYNISRFSTIIHDIACFDLRDANLYLYLIGVLFDHPGFIMLSHRP